MFVYDKNWHFKILTVDFIAVVTPNIHDKTASGLIFPEICHGQFLLLSLASGTFFRFCVYVKFSSGHSK